MLFSYDKKLNFPDISGSATIKLIKLLLLNFQAYIFTKKMNFVNHITGTEMSMKVAKSIGLLYKLNHFLPETILETLYTSLIHPCISYGHGMETWHVQDW